MLVGSGAAIKLHRACWPHRLAVLDFQEYAKWPISHQVLASTRCLALSHRTARRTCGANEMATVPVGDHLATCCHTERGHPSGAIQASMDLDIAFQAATSSAFRPVPRTTTTVPVDFTSTVTLPTVPTRTSSPLATPSPASTPRSAVPAPSTPASSETLIATSAACRPTLVLASSTSSGSARSPPWHTRASGHGTTALLLRMSARRLLPATRRLRGRTRCGTRLTACREP